MEVFFFDLSLILHVILNAFLVWLVWQLSSKLYAHIKLMKRVQDSGVQTIRCNPMVGLLFVLLKGILFGPKNIPTNAALLPVGEGMAVVFRKDGICRLDAGWIRQVVLVYTKGAAEAILNDPREQKKSEQYKFFSDFLGTGLLTASYGTWKKHRRVLSPAFNSRVLDSFQPVIYDHAQNLVHVIKSTLRSEPVSIEGLLSKCSLGIVTETAMGIKFGSGTEKDLAYVTAVREILKILGRRIVAPWLWNDVLFRLSPSGLKLRKHMKTVNTFVGEIIRKKKAEINADSSCKQSEISGFKRRPFLELLLLHNTICGKADKLTDEEILDETFTFTFAGFDTVSVTLLWVVYYMGLHPEVMKKAWTEVTAVLHGDKEREIRLEDLKQMEYLENVIKETQRLRPVVPVLLRILRHDITIGNVTLPKGATVGVALKELHTREDAFPNGEKFDPDRFTDAKLSTFQLMPFSAGPRNCIGQSLAVLEMKTILSNLIRHLDWESLDPECEVLSNPDLVTRPHKSLNILFRERL